MLETLLNGRYRVIRALGSGGFGQTYVAEDTHELNNLTCVVKQFQPSRQDEDFLKIARRLFFSEVETLRKLGSHNQIPALLDDFEEHQEFFLVQEYVEGQSLDEELATIKRLSESEAIALLQDVLQVLEFVHQNHVIHRDIKPSNLIRRKQDNKFVLIDFGAVKEIQTQILTETGLTGNTIGIGTQGYGSSEQLMGKPRYSSDLYGLGMTVIHALTGIHPLQLPVHPNTGEVIWRDQATVSPRLAAILDKMVRYHFSQRYQSAGEVLQSLNQQTEIPTDSTQLPSTRLTGFPKTEVLDESLSGLTQVRRRLIPEKTTKLLTLGAMSLAAIGVIFGIRQLGWLQPLELAMLDRMVQASPDLGPDPRLLVVGITENDIQQQKRFPLPDRTIAEVLKKLKTYHPRAIGLDLLRDLPQEPGHAELLSELKAPNVIVITKLGDATTPTISAPSGVPFNQVGFNDFVLDSDSVIRRNLMFADDKGTTFHSFTLRLALKYLAAQGLVLKPDNQVSDKTYLGKAVFEPLDSNSGGYRQLDARGYQILLRYRGKAAARQVSLADVLSGKLQPEWVQDKVVLIGTTASSAKDLFLTPYSVTEQDSPKTAGVLLHAQMVSQILGAALDGQPLFWFWPEWVEVVWIMGWAIIGGSLVWFVRYPVVLGLSIIVLLAALVAIGFGLFIQQGWVPIAAPALAAGSAGAIALVSRPAKKQRPSREWIG